MRTWNDYKEYVKSSGPEGKREIEDCEELSRTISAAVNGLHNFGLVGLALSAQKRKAQHKEES